MFDVKRILITDLDDPIIHEITTRMSRFACDLETNEECLREDTFLIETEVPIVLKCYAPDKVTNEKNVYITPKEQKSGSRIFITPGVIALVMFLKTPRINLKTAKEATDLFINYFVKRIKGAYSDNNDILINGKKIFGISVFYNEALETTNIKFMLTYSSVYIKYLTSKEDFENRKYDDITGVCEETDLSAEDVCDMVNEFTDLVLSWRNNE